MLKALNDGGNKGGIRLDDLVELSDPAAELTLNAMFPQSCSDLVILLAEDVLARVGQEVIMANEVRYSAGNTVAAAFEIALLMSLTTARGSP